MRNAAPHPFPPGVEKVSESPEIDAMDPSPKTRTEPPCHEKRLATAKASRPSCTAARDKIADASSANTRDKIADASSANTYDHPAASRRVSQKTSGKPAVASGRKRKQVGSDLDDEDYVEVLYGGK